MTKSEKQLRQDINILIIDIIDTLAPNTIAIAIADELDKILSKSGKE